MNNNMASRPVSKLKGDPYRAYEALPVEVRLALQESLVDWCPLRAREWYQHLLGQLRLRPAQAVAFLVQTIRSQDHAELAAFAKAWPKGAEAYPHLAAGATLQRYTGTEGIPFVVALPVPVPVPVPVAARAPARVAARVAVAAPKRVKARGKPAKGRRSRR